MVSPFTAAALTRANAERAAYRSIACAALDALHAAHLREQRLREQLTELREEQARYARGIFSE